MKQKGIILIVLLGLIALIFALRSGIFQGSDDEYVHQRIPEVVDYNFHIKPILSDNCYTCHGPDAGQRKGGFRLDLEEEAFLELPENPGKYAIVPGDPGRSLLYRHVVSDDPKEIMPPVDSQLKLNRHEKKLLKKWIEQGAKFERHWAYIPPKKAVLPETEETGWAQNEIDYFVLEKLEEHNLSPSERAADGTLLRRIALDLTGLPPNVVQLERYLSDGQDIVVERAIDEFLASPAYGERMAQSWMDVARYADSHGYQDDSYRSMWPWRDWVIHAFNANLPYDEFLVEQLAGDLLPNATRDQILATGFNRNHPITQEGGVIQEEYQSYYVSDRTNTLGTGILGLTLECAKCHDHKYDAISQREYFELYAFFNNVAEKGIRMDAVAAANQKYFADAPYMVITDEEANGVLSFINKKEEGVVKVMVMNDSMPRETFVFNRGEYYDLGEKVGPDTPEAIFPYSDDLPRNRLGLAKWATDENNPLTARVYVNRLWAMLFGKGLVATPGDFGVQGSLPTHPKLLDWLSRDFMDHGWDIKYLLKKIMLSATYQQGSIASTELKRADPENLFLGRAQRFRMSGEMIRDYMLATSGLLNAELGGPSVKPYQPAGLWEETNAGGRRGILTSYVMDGGKDLYRRSLYTFWKRTMPPASMSIFDAPTRDLCEVQRQKTNTPLQALALQNDVQMLEAARVLAESTLVENKNSRDAVTTIFRRILIREPKEEEREILGSYFEDALNRFSTKKEDAERFLAQGEHARLGTDPAQTAALMLTAQVIYNLDETITKE